MLLRLWIYKDTHLFRRWAKKTAVAVSCWCCGRLLPKRDQAQHDTWAMNVGDASGDRGCNRLERNGFFRVVTGLGLQVMASQAPLEVI